MQKKQKLLPLGVGITAKLATLMKRLVQIVIVVFFVQLVIQEAKSQCSTSVPAAPSCPSSATTASTAGSDLVVSPPTTGTRTYKLPSSPYTGGNLFTTNPVGYVDGKSVLYVCSGQTLTFNDDVSASSNVTIYVLAGGTLTVKQNLNKLTIYVYGTLNTTSAGTNYIQGTTNIYIGSTGYWNAPNTITLTTSGSIINQGYMQLSTVSQIGSGTLCNKSTGCTKITSLPPAFNVYKANYFDGDGTGTLWVTTALKPSYSYRLTSTTSTIKVCTAQTSPYTNAGPPSFDYWGNSTNTSYSCSTTPSGCSIPLPVSLTYFKATKQEESVIVRWGILKSWDSDYFVVEKSKNGIDWDEIGIVNSIKDNDSFKEFSFTDNNPLSGLNYYRLSEVDNKEKKQVYSISFVEIDSFFNGFSLYPNPSNGIVNVHILGEDYDYEFKLLDFTGREVKKLFLPTGTSTIENNLPSGVYYGQLKVGIDTFIQKVLVQ